MKRRFGENRRFDTVKIGMIDKIGPKIKPIFSQIGQNWGQFD